MRFPFKVTALFGFVGVTILAFWLGRLSVSGFHSQNTAPAVVISSVTEPGPGLQPKPGPATVDTELPQPVGTKNTRWEDRWRALMAKPANRAREQDIITAIEELAATDPHRALSLAAAEANQRLRLEMYRAALRGWSLVSPEAAADWALSAQQAIEKNDAISAVLAGAVKKSPDAALQLTTRLTQLDPQHSREHGIGLIAALSNAGEFERAARFATSASGDNREDWINTAYSMWADYQPIGALTSIAALDDLQVRRNALNAALTSWACNDPRAVANYAAELGASDEKIFAITTALRNWAANDPVAAAYWIRERDPSPELDAGAASVAADIQDWKQPSLAIEWAESITDPDLRSSTLVTVIRQWAESDPVAAKAYLKETHLLRPTDAAELIADLAGTNTE